ncbi:MAG: ABC transporter ATP-binding protein [Corynebacterium sp.]|uniref:ABC transporter ATP-binding protein n=1 Tax=Corynebacterium sp. TaxID=1720 RepID=UPI0026DCAD7C|nr:ABC transporter ATP-binding protein [Corynebacterium sp.]MDO5097985.1 ABC transporter ATP-binding protein [Corynebacterium sp.]
MDNAIPNDFEKMSGAEHNSTESGYPAPPHPAPIAFEVVNLCKRFGTKIAVNNLSLAVPRGSIFGVVGPNGAGKTTMLNMATGLLRPDSGRAVICGHDMWTDPIAAKAAMGLLADGVPVFDRLTGCEYLEYLGALRGMDPTDISTRSVELLSALGLTEARDQQIVDYSAGMTKKILLAGALLHNPRVLVLDEPLEAVDPVSGRIIQQILKAYAAAGGTVVMSSHVMELVEGLCDHVAVIHQGNVRVAGTVEKLAAEQSLTDLFVAIVGGGELAEGQLAWLRQTADAPEQKGNGYAQ